MEQQTQTETVKRVNRVGNWTSKEIKFIQENSARMSVEEIAAQLNRNENTIRNYIRDKMPRDVLNIELTAVESTEFNIKRSPIWKEIKSQLTDDELDIFMYHWTNIGTQFRGDVLPTERMQIVDLCRNEVLLDRILKKIKDISVIVDDLKTQLKTERAKTPKDVVKVSDLERLVAETIIASNNFSKEYQDLSTQKQKCLKEIKGTREQRIKRIEDSKESLTSWMSAIISNSELRKKFAIESGKMKLATEIELKRLSDFHTYADGEVSRPIMSADTVTEQD